MPYEIYLDDGFITGTHEGVTNLHYLKSSSVDFDLAGAVGRLVKNETDGSSGIVLYATPLDPNYKASYLYVNLTGGSLNRWTTGDRFTIFIGTVEDAEISRTVICKKSGFAYPRKDLIDGEHPDETDMDQESVDPENPIVRRKA